LGSLLHASKLKSNLPGLQVIYHLNNKNEEHELDLQELAEQYESEIEQILKDAADKVNFFKHQLDTDRDDERLKAVAKVGGTSAGPPVACCMTCDSCRSWRRGTMRSARKG
jgi:hypothetical protein